MLAPDLDHLLATILDAHESIFDLVFVVGRPLQAEVDGELRAIPAHPAIQFLTPHNIEKIALTLLGENQRLLRELLQHGTCECTYQLAGRARFRANIFRQRGNLAVVLRRTQSEMPTFASLSLPPMFGDVAQMKHGLVIIAGATGSGKASTLSAIVDEINSTRSVHIVTLEDPVEFVHPHRRATVTQRELGADFTDYPSGLRGALRQAPKVVMISELSDRATLDLALTAAETGRLVLAAVQANDAAQVVHKLVNLFDPTEQARARLRLMEMLRVVASQRLVPRIGGGRELVQEIMGTNARVREAIALGEAEHRTFYDIIEFYHEAGWSTFDQALARACLADRINEETALLYATNKNRLTRFLDDGAKKLGKQMDASMQLRLDAATATPPTKTPPPGPNLRLSA